MKKKLSEERIQICFTQDQRKMLDTHSKETGNSIGTIVRIAVIDYFYNLEQG